MGGCATKPKVLESKEAPLPVEAAGADATTEKAETTVLQESETGDETMKEKTLVDVTDVVVAPKEEATKDCDEAKPATEAVPKDVEVEAEVKEVVETVATTEAPKAAETDVIPEAPKAAEEAKEK